MLTFLNAVIIMTKMCVFLGLRSDEAECSIYVDCDAATLDNRISYLSRERVEFSFSRGVMSKKNILTIRRHEDDTAMSRDVGMRLPSGVASYRRRLESSENVFLSVFIVIPCSR